MRDARLNPPVDGATRVATYNIKELSTDVLMDVSEDGVGRDPRGISSAKVIQRVRPDVLVVQEIDHDYAHTGDLRTNAERYLKHYLNQGEDAIDYPYIYAAPCNTGILSGQDLNNDGFIATQEDERRGSYAADCYGYGLYQGQYSMVVFSQQPLLEAEARTFQNFLWVDMPGNHIIDELFPPPALAVARLSSKSHWDLPVTLRNGRQVNLLISHPTPQGFDGPENRNGRRNFDEIKLWADYISGADYLVDDAGTRGGLGPDANFLIVGDLNAEPRRGSFYDGQYAMDQLLDHPRVVETKDWLQSKGALRNRPAGAPRFWENSTIGERDGARFDYLLPSDTLDVVGGGVFWPSATEDFYGALLSEHASDHRLIWVDLK